MKPLTPVSFYKRHTPSWRTKSLVEDGQLPAYFNISFLVSRRYSICFRKRLTIRQLNVPTATAEIEKQDNLSNIISIQFQNCDFFLWGILWSRGSVNVDKLHEKYQYWGSFFWQSCRMRVCSFTKNALLSKYFSRFPFRFVVTYQNFAIF